jgi:GNAT superfamily N-acetyltransferase
MERAPGARPRGFIAFGQGHLSILRVRDTERIEVEAMRSLFSIPGVRGALGEAGGAIAVRVDGLPIKELNRMLGVYSISEVDELEHVFDGRPHWITVDPEAGLDGGLRERGYVHTGDWRKFVRGAEPYPARTDLDVEDARSREDVTAFLERAWGIPPPEAEWMSGVHALPGWHCFIAYDGAVPVGGGMLYVLDDVGWVGVAATQLEYRGRGVQSAVFAARFERARSLGLRLLVTETGITDPPGPSYRNMLRAGFEPVYARPVYAASEAESSSSSGSRPR